MLFKNGLMNKIEPLQESVFKKSHISVKAYLPKVNIFIERDRFIIKTAENNDELIKALKLRHEVFYRELLNRKLLLGIDYDRFDLKCDHLILIDKKNGRYFGTYRLNSSKFIKKFYSETEFRLENILNLEGTKLELGRACVHREYRNGCSIALLWRGITEYMKTTDAKYLFGCSSIKITDRYKIAAIHKFLMKNHKIPSELQVSTKGKFKIRNFNKLLDAVTFDEIEKAVEMIPPLLKSYLNMGAFICGEPAFDRKFKCVDYFTFFNLEQSNKIQKKYRV